MTDPTPAPSGPLDLLDHSASLYLALAAFNRARTEGQPAEEAIRRAVVAARDAAVMHWSQSQGADTTQEGTACRS